MLLLNTKVKIKSVIKAHEVKFKPKFQFVLPAYIQFLYKPLLMKHICGHKNCI